MRSSACRISSVPRIFTRSEKSSLKVFITKSQSQVSFGKSSFFTNPMAHISAHSDSYFQLTFTASSQLASPSMTRRSMRVSLSMHPKRLFRKSFVPCLSSSVSSPLSLIVQAHIIAANEQIARAITSSFSRGATSSVSYRRGKCSIKGTPCDFKISMLISLRSCAVLPILATPALLFRALSAPFLNKPKTPTPPPLNLHKFTRVF